VLGASWQRCRTHFARNLLTRVPKAAQGFVAAAVRSIFEQADAGEVRAQHDRVVEQMRERFPDAAKLLEEARDDVLAFAAFPRAHWRQIWSNNPLERLNKEIGRRTDVVGIFPNRGAVVQAISSDRSTVVPMDVRVRGSFLTLLTACRRGYLRLYPPLIA
jgi:putative transposase